ncbi:hypothetical protein D3C73_1433590 [compost metagenome]
MEKAEILPTLHIVIVRRLVDFIIDTLFQPARLRITTDDGRFQEDSQLPLRVLHRRHQKAEYIFVVHGLAILVSERQTVTPAPPDFIRRR